VTGDEDEAEKVVSNGVVEREVEIRQGLFEEHEVASQIFLFPVGDSVATEEIDGAAFGGGGEPCAGVFGDTGSRPLFQGGEQGLLCEVFGKADVSGEASEPGDDASRLDAPDGFNGAVWIGSRHCYRSHQIRSMDARASPLQENHRDTGTLVSLCLSVV